MKYKLFFLLNLSCIETYENPENAIVHTCMHVSKENLTDNIQSPEDLSLKKTHVFSLKR